MDKKFSKCLSVFILVFLCYSGVWAQENEDRKNNENREEIVRDNDAMLLDNILVISTRDSASAFSAPNSAVVVNNREILRSQAATTKELLDDIANVDFDNSSIGPIQRPSVRGLDQNEIILKVDGVRQTYRGTGGIAANPVLIDPSLLKEVEVLRGPASVLHGSGGIGGVISMKTVDASDLLKEDSNFGTTHRSGYSSALGEFSQTVSAYGRYGISDLLVSGTFRNYGEYQSSSPEKEYQSTKREGENYSGLFKLSLFLDDQDVSLSLNTFNDDLDRSGTKYKAEQQRVNGKYNVFKDNGLIDFHVSSQYINRVNKYDNGVRDLEDDYHSTGIDMYNVFSGSFTESVTYDVTLGGDASFDHQEGKDDGETDPSRPDADAGDYGIFGRFNLGLFDQLFIMPSARYSYYSREANDSVFGAKDQSDSRISPQLTLQWVPFEWLNIFGSYADTYRAPTIDEIYFEMDYSPWPIRVVANPDLKPEIAKTYEAGFGLKFDNVITSDDGVRFKAVVFTENIQDFISASPDFVMNNGIMEYTNENTGEVDRTGIEIDTGIRISNYSLDVAYGVINGEDKDSDEKTGSVPQNIIVTCGAAFPKTGLSFYWKSKFVEESDYAFFTDSVPAYNVHGVGLVWLPKIGSLENYRIDLGINNIFDEEYETYRGSTDTGRDVRVSCTASF